VRSRVKLAAILWLCLASISASSAAAAADNAPTALVRLTRLHKGSLPRIVTAYGRVRPDSASRLCVMAPLSAVVDAVYVRLGEEIAAGAPLVRLGPSPQTASAYTQAQSAVSLAADLVQRTRTMLAQHLATAQTLATAQKSAADARAALTALAAQGAGGAQILHAPFHAIVTALSTSPGAIVAAGSALLDLARPNGLVLEVGVVPSEAAAIRTGDTANVTALGARGPVPGKVQLRGAAVDPSTGLLPVEIGLPSGALLPGEMASAGIVTKQVPGYIVPHAAILVDPKGTTYVVQAVGGVAKEIPVRVLAADGEQNVVAGPFDPAAPLVLAGNYQLTDGMKVRVGDPNGTIDK
jgi:membrane fusion protein, multidrug efflux system